MCILTYGRHVDLLAESSTVVVGYVQGKRRQTELRRLGKDNKAADRIDRCSYPINAEAAACGETILLATCQRRDVVSRFPIEHVAASVDPKLVRTA